MLYKCLLDLQCTQFMRSHIGMQNSSLKDLIKANAAIDLGAVSKMRPLTIIVDAICISFKKRLIRLILEGGF